MTKTQKIRLRPSEQKRLNRVREFLVKLKEKMRKVGGEFLHDREEPIFITADSIDPKNMTIQTGTNCSRCLAAGWGPYYDEEAKHFEEWFEDFKCDFYMAEPIRVE